MVGGKGKGKKKIEITRIVDKPKRSVTFSKRRKGLFKKAAELDVLCGSDTAIISVSEAGTIFAAGRPSFVHALLLGTSAGGGRGGVQFDEARLERMGWDELANELAALNESQLEIELLMVNRGNAAASAMSLQKAHVAAAATTAPPPPAFPTLFVDAAAATTAPPPPSFPTLSSSSSSSELEDETTSFLPPGDVEEEEEDIFDFLHDEELIALPILEEDDQIFDFMQDEELIALLQSDI